MKNIKEVGKEYIMGNKESILEYRKYIKKKKMFIVLLLFLLSIAIVIAINAGSYSLSIKEMLKALIMQGDDNSNAVIWNLRMPRIVTAIIVGLALSLCGCVMQNILKNPLAAPSTLGISSGAVFGANIAIVIFAAGSQQNMISNSVIINNPYLVTTFAFIFAMIASITIIFLARIRGFMPEAIILSGVALSSLFGAGTTLIQYFAEDTEVASAVFWTFGDLSRTTLKEISIMFLVVLLGFVYFYFKRWDYNTLDGGQEAAKSLGVKVLNVRMVGMMVSSLLTATVVSFVGIIGFIGLVSPHIVRRIIGNDHRYLIPASGIMGALLLLLADSLGRVIIAPIVLPVGAITSFLGAPVFLYILFRKEKRL